MEFKIMIIEQLGTTVTVQADDTDSALEKARSMYRNSEIVLTADNYVGTDFMLVDEESAQSSDFPCDMKCTCGCIQFSAKQIKYHHVIVGGETAFEVDTYKSGPLYGPYICIKCGAKYSRGDSDSKELIP